MEKTTFVKKDNFNDEENKMDGSLWLGSFAKDIDELYNETNNGNWTAPKWTDFLGKVLDKVAEKMNCKVKRRSDNKEESGEYLNIDGLFFDNDAPKTEQGDPLALPRVAVELENSHFHDKIAYCLWKLMCLRTSVKVLICHQDNKKKIEDLKAYLQNVILQGKLMQGQDADILLLVGNEDRSIPEKAEWNAYYSVFEWRNDGFQQIKDLDW